MRVGIDVGDKVHVHFGASRSILYGKILYAPQSTGDSWVIEHKDGVSNVQMFERMDKIDE